ncbi:Non-motile and phage-resistance protein [compost metagenome]
MTHVPPLSHESFGIGTLFGRMSDAVLIVELATSRIVLCNPAAEALFGHGPGELLGRSPEAIVPGGFPACLTTGSPVELEARRSDGRPCWIEVSLSPIDNRLKPGTYHLVIARDITQRRHLAAALVESEARFRAFMEYGPAVASMRDEDGRYVYLNAKHHQLFGSEGWLGTTPHDQMPAEVADRLLAEDRLVRDSGRPTHFEQQLPGTDQTITLMVIKFPFHGKSGRCLIGSLGVDITALKSAQATLLERTQALEEANRALRLADSYKDQFLSVLSHELRTPISLIIGFTELLDDHVGGALNDTQQSFVSQIERATQRLLVLVNNLIDFAQLQAGTFQLHLHRADLVDAVREMTDTFRPRAEAAGVTWVADWPSGPLWATIDSRQVGRVMDNLLDNALKFTPPGGTVAVRATRRGSHLRTEVTDTGVGIPEYDMPKLFDRFWQYDMSSTRAEGGLGLGLPIAKAIVEAHGGTIGAFSRPGAGTTVWFDLPLDP